PFVCKKFEKTLSLPEPIFDGIESKKLYFTSFYPLLYFYQHILEYRIIVFHAIVQIDANHLIRKVVDLFFINTNFFRLRLQLIQFFVQFHTLPGSSIGNTFFQISHRRAVTALLFMDIVRAYAGNGIRLIAVHINQSFETILLPTVKQPVNRAFLINLAMVFVKIIQEIVPNHILRLTFASQGIGNEFQIFIQSVLSIDSLYKFYETADNI